MDAIGFAKRLITTGDLDPLYIALWKARLERSLLCKWLVAYWCYYHPGLCCRIVDSPGFWPAMSMVARGGKSYPRGVERRHFRGNTSVRAISELRSRFPNPCGMIHWLTDVDRCNAANVCRRVTTLYGFGDWVKWKIADMLDRLDLAPVRFSEDDLGLMFSSSKDGAMKICEQFGLRPSLVSAHRLLIRSVRLKAPPRYERSINVQETETVFCKWKSHLSGHYPVGKDTIDIEEGLLKYPGKTSNRLLDGIRIVKEKLDV